jgi:hypothetical protein
MNLKERMLHLIIQHPKMVAIGIGLAAATGGSFDHMAYAYIKKGYNNQQNIP